MVRTHPFANGNGRTARLWAIWVAVRYGLPATVHPAQAPPAGQQAAAFASMTTTGRHALTAAVFGEMLNDYLRNGPDEQ
jgi:Fic family protein